MYFPYRYTLVSVSFDSKERKLPSSTSVSVKFSYDVPLYGDILANFKLGSRCAPTPRALYLAPVKPLFFPQKCEIPVRRCSVNQLDYSQVILLFAQLP